MKPEALALECIRAIQQQPELPFIVIIGKLPVKGWPRGKCIGSDSRGRFYSYDAWKMLGSLAALGAIGLGKLEPGRMPIQVAGETHVVNINGDQWFHLTKRIFENHARAMMVVSTGEHN